MYESRRVYEKVKKKKHFHFFFGGNSKMTDVAVGQLVHSLRGYLKFAEEFIPAIHPLYALLYHEYVSERTRNFKQYAQTTAEKWRTLTNEERNKYDEESCIILERRNIYRCTPYEIQELIVALENSAEVF